MAGNTRTYIVHAVNAEQEDILKAFFNALKIIFEAPYEQPYNKDFVNMVLQAEDGIKNGKGKKVSSEEFDNLWNLLANGQGVLTGKTVSFTPLKTILC